MRRPAPDGKQPHPPVHHPACQKRVGGGRNRLPSVGPPRLRISPAFQPDVQKAGGHHAVGIHWEDAVMMPPVFRSHFSSIAIIRSSQTSAPHSSTVYLHCRETIHCPKRASVSAFAGWLSARHQGDTGTISLPLRPDIDDRPRQIVDFVHGREAVTDYTVLDILTPDNIQYPDPVLHVGSDGIQQMRADEMHEGKPDIEPDADTDIYGRKLDNVPVGYRCFRLRDIWRNGQQDRT